MIVPGNFNYDGIGKDTWEKKMEDKVDLNPKKGKLSNKNIIILTDYEKNIISCLETAFTPIETKKDNPSIFSDTIDYVYSYFPTKETVGTEVSRQVGLTYSSSLSNKLVAAYVNRFLPQSTSWYNWIRGVSTTTGLQLAITPFLGPALGILITGAGGIVIPSLVVLTQSVYKKYTKEEIDKLHIKTIEDLFKYDKEKGLWSDAFGNPIDDKLIEDTRDAIDQIEIINQVKELSPDEVKNFFMSKLIKTEIQEERKTLVKCQLPDGLISEELKNKELFTLQTKTESRSVYTFHDGLILDDEMMKLLDTAVCGLTSPHTFGENKKKIQKFIQLLAIHTKKPTEASDWKSLVVECYTQPENQPNNRTLLGYCLRATGEPLNFDEVKEIQEECAQIAEEIIEPLMEDCITKTEEWDLHQKVDTYIDKMITEIKDSETEKKPDAEMPSEIAVTIPLEDTNSVVPEQKPDAEMTSEIAVTIPEGDSNSVNPEQKSDTEEV